MIFYPDGITGLCLTADYFGKFFLMKSLVVAWLTSDGWEVLIPAIDHGKKTDLVISEGSDYYHIQVKSIESDDESIKVDNKWKGVKNRFCELFFKNQRLGNT